MLFALFGLNLFIFKKRHGSSVCLLFSIFFCLCIHIYICIFFLHMYCIIFIVLCSLYMYVHLSIKI